jgi:hypothetical protein
MYLGVVVGESVVEVVRSTPVGDATGASAGSIVGFV